MLVDCPTCKLLWDEFVESVKAHFTILSKRQLARVEQDTALVKVLEPLEWAASELRGKTRMTLDEHEATHQDGGAKTQTA